MSKHLDVGSNQYISAFDAQREIVDLARIFHTFSAATPFSTASADRIAETPLRSVPTRLHRHSADSINPDGTLRRFATKKYEICGLAISGRVLLAGDAAHVMTPIGGQGMNVGWMDACDAAEVRAKVLTNSIEDVRSCLRSYNKKVLLRASRAVERAA